MTKLEIINGSFYINNIKTNKNNNLSEGKLIGIYTDICAFYDKNLNFDIYKNKIDFINNLKIWRKSGINLITVGLQSPNPFDEYYKKAREQDKTKNISFNSSALNSNGSLNYNYLENACEIINAANNLGFIVLLNILSSSCEDIFEDEFALINGVLNITDWLLMQNFSNVLVNITDVSHTFYKSSVLSGEKTINILKTVREKAKNKIILGMGIKSFTNFSEKNIDEYINLSDFIPFYQKQNHNTGKMLENIYFFKSKMQKLNIKIPLIMAKGDDLDEKYNSYGKNNLIEALENGVSWCYYDKDGFVILPVDWDKDSSAEKRRFFEVVRNNYNLNYSSNTR